MAMDTETAVFCDDCLQFIGYGSASQYEECEMCGSTSLIEDYVFYCTCGMYSSLTPFDVCPECGEPA